MSAAGVERTMKLQDVLLKAMAKKISWMEAAEIAGVTECGFSNIDKVSAQCNRILNAIQHSLRQP